MVIVGSLLFVIFAVALFFTGRRAWADPTLNKVFWPLLMGVLAYISFEVVMWSLNMPLVVMMTIGITPLVLVMMGFRYYEYYNKPENKAKNQAKSKAAEDV